MTRHMLLDSRRPRRPLYCPIVNRTMQVMPPHQASLRIFRLRQRGKQVEPLEGLARLRKLPPQSPRNVDPRPSRISILLPKRPRPFHLLTQLLLQALW